MASWLEDTFGGKAQAYQLAWDRLPADAQERARAREVWVKGVAEWDLESLDCGARIDDREMIPSHRRRIDDWREACERNRPDRLDR